jgi:hypothetical protein
MPIVIPGSASPNAVGNYSGLIQSVMDTLKDDSLESAIPRFIYLAEARFDRLLYPLNDEVTASLALATGASSVSLPSDYKTVRTLYQGTSPSAVLTQLGPDDFRSKYLDSQPGTPCDYAIQGGSILIGPEADADYTLTLTYIQGIPTLSEANQTNWLIEAHPDLYFFGALMYAELHGWNDDRAHDFDGAVDRIIAEIQGWDARRRKGRAHAVVAGSYF